MEKAYSDASAGTALEQTLTDPGVAETIRSRRRASSASGAPCTAPWAVVVSYLDSIASSGMEWPGRRARSVSPGAVGF